ncbi:MAG: DUF4412 domain-containing protein [Chlorobiaceae bacterium]|nr:DUF4412 domain-containing protein [Chlorobiaceae bacterium]
MKKLYLVTIALLFMVLAIPSNAPAAFTGQMEMKLSMPNGTADISYLFGQKNQRMDMAMKLDKIPEPLNTTVITSSSKPDEATIVNHRNRTWSIVNLRTAAENATLLDFDSNYRFHRVGTELLKGYRCEHVQLFSTTEKLDLWMSRELADFSTFRLLQSQNPRLSNTSLARTLEKNGIEGFPVRIVQKNDNGLYIMELTRVSAQSIPSFKFIVPVRYRKIQAEQPSVDSSQKKHLRSLMEKMKDFEK